MSGLIPQRTLTNVGILVRTRGLPADTVKKRVINDDGVVAEGERIVAVGPVPNLDVPADAEEIDAVESVLS